MSTRNYIDMASGCVLLLLGLSVAWYAAAHYTLGTLNNMGPGMFPMGLGIIVALFGIGVLAPTAAATNWSVPQVEWRAAITVLVSIAIFAICVRWIGLLPAVALTTIAATLATDEFRLVRSLVLAVVLSAMAGLIFIVGLSLPFIAFRWPF